MKYLPKILLYLFLASLFVIFGYQIIKYARDIVRIWNAKTLVSTLIMYESKNSDLPASSKEKPITQVLFQKSLTSSQIRDPVFTSSTVILDEYAHLLLQVFAQVSQYAPSELKDNMKVLQELSEQKEIDPELVFAFTQNKGKFEVSVKLESPFSRTKMKNDEGNDLNRYELGTNLALDTSLITQNGLVQAKNPEVQIIK